MSRILFAKNHFKFFASSLADILPLLQVQSKRSDRSGLSISGGRAFDELHLRRIEDPRVGNEIYFRFGGVHNAINLSNQWASI